MFTIVARTTTWIKAHLFVRAIAATIVFLSWPYTAGVYLTAVVRVILTKIRSSARQSLLS
jgi:hypothetical protein